MPTRFDAHSRADVPKRRGIRRLVAVAAPLLTATLVLAAAPGRASMPMMDDPLSLKASGQTGSAHPKPGVRSTKARGAQASKKARRLRARQRRR